MPQAASGGQWESIDRLWMTETLAFSEAGRRALPPDLEEDEVEVGDEEAAQPDPGRREPAPHHPALALVPIPSG